VEVEFRRDMSSRSELAHRRKKGSRRVHAGAFVPDAELSYGRVANKEYEFELG
jgi:hypothetical protein